jgi:hypothetical protein
MPSSSDSEPEEEVMSDSNPEEELPKSRMSLVPLAATLCALSYVYGLWLGAYMCPK